MRNVKLSSWATFRSSTHKGNGNNPGSLWLPAKIEGGKEFLRRERGDIGKCIAPLSYERAPGSARWVIHRARYLSEGPSFFSQWRANGLALAWGGKTSGEVDGESEDAPSSRLLFSKELVI